MKNWVHPAIVLVIALFGCSPSPVVQNPLKEQACASETRHENRPQVLPVTAKVVIEEEVIELEVAGTPEQIALGLMFRDDLPDDRGMLFIYEPASIASAHM